MGQRDRSKFAASTGTVGGLEELRAHVEACTKIERRKRGNEAFGPEVCPFALASMRSQVPARPRAKRRVWYGSQLHGVPPAPARPLFRARPSVAHARCPTCACARAAPDRARARPSARLLARVRTAHAPCAPNRPSPAARVPPRARARLARGEPPARPQARPGRAPA